ncbi:unnamed protein product, partial [Didymodactylos carnosus]
PISYYDIHKANELSSKLSSNIDKIQNGIGYQLSPIPMMIAMTSGGVLLAFITNWRLTLVLLIPSPFLAVAWILFREFTVRITINELNSYSKSNSVAQEVFSSIRTVFAYNASQYEQTRYSKYLDSAKNANIKKGITFGCYMGGYSMMLFFSYAIGLYASYWLLISLNDSVKIDKDTFIGDIIIVIIAITDGIFSIGGLAQHVEALEEARAAATEIWQILDEEQQPLSEENSAQSESKKDQYNNNDDINGDIEFDNVQFAYPTREMNVLNNFNLIVHQNEKIALVGMSGAG